MTVGIEDHLKRSPDRDRRGLEAIGGGPKKWGCGHSLKRGKKTEEGVEVSSKGGKRGGKMYVVGVLSV